jgi:hypothetical protein
MKTAKKILFFSITLTISVLMSLQASNVRITTPRVVYAGSDDALASSIPVTNDSIAMIIFDISWENSWRTVSPNNWDAVWLFVKFYDGTTWLPTFLDKDPSNHVAGNPSENGYYVTTKANPSNVKGGMTIKPGFSTSYNQYRGTYGKECVGVFLYRSELGEGKVRIKSVNLKWNYKNQGQVKDNDLVVKVFAVEMVYVREGEFYVGDGSTTSTGGFVKSSGTTPFGLNAYKILSENEITVGNTQDNLWTYNDAQPVLINNLEIPKTFPKGYRAFYAMKYELTQEAYGEMLNCLSSQQANRNTPVYDEVAYANTVGSLNVGSVQGAGGWGPNNNGNPIKRVVLSWKKGSG